jgi:hypothetical protein
VPVKLVWASRGKATRAEPISAISEQGRDHHVGSFPQLEDELCLWIPGDASPNRLDAKVWALTELSERPEPRKATQSQYRYGHADEERHQENLRRHPSQAQALRRSVQLLRW